MLVINKLSGLLDEQLKICKKLLELENQKTEILLKGDFKALDDIVTRQQPYIMSSANCEKRREKLLDEMGASGLTLRQIIESNPQAKPLKSAFSQLNDVAAQLKKACEKNKAILDSKLKVINYILSTTGASDDGMITYSNIRQGQD